MSEKLLTCSSSPHIRAKIKTSNIMMRVILALLPTSVMGIYFFGIRALFILLFSVCCAIFFEGAWCAIAKKPLTIFDGSAAVTGLLIGLNVSTAVPLHIILIANGFAIIVVKQFFGGLGHNFINPAMAARAFMIICYPRELSSFPMPLTAPDAVSSATVLSGGAVSHFNAFIGNMQGCIGEVSAVAIILGGVYLILTKTIKIHIPLSFIGTVFVCTYFAGKCPIMGILSGGVMLGAFFMATDYVTSPITNKGKIIMGIGCGAITSVIRLWGSYPEGVTFAILLMNCVAPLIDKFFIPGRKER